MFDSVGTVSYFSRNFTLLHMEWEPTLCLEANHLQKIHAVMTVKARILLKVEVIGRMQEGFEEQRCDDGFIKARGSQIFPYSVEWS